MPKPRRVSNILALAVLSTVYFRPMHPYEMAATMRAHGKDHDMKIKWGSLYTVVQNLEKHGFIAAVSGNHVEFDFHGRHQQLLTMITADDVRWAAGRMQRLTDQQWRDAFRAGNYSEDDAQRFIARIKEKIDDGLALRVDRRLTND